MGALQTAWKYAPLFALVVINTIAALYDVLTSWGLRDSTVHPTVFAALRGTGSAVLLAGWGYWRERSRPAGDRMYVPKAEDVGLLIATGTLALCGHMGLSALALSMVAPALVGMFAPVAPAIAFVLALGLGMETFDRRSWSSWLKLVGAAVTLSGGITAAAVAMSGERVERGRGRGRVVLACYRPTVASQASRTSTTSPRTCHWGRRSCSPPSSVRRGT